MAAVQRQAAAVQRLDRWKEVVLAHPWLLSCAHRARAVFANLTAVARVTPIFQEYGIEDYFTFFDLAKMLGFVQITISNGRDFAHQVTLQ